MSGTQRIHVLASCTSVTVNGNGNSLSNSFTSTLSAADEPNREYVIIKNKYQRY